MKLGLRAMSKQEDLEDVDTDVATRSRSLQWVQARIDSVTVQRCDTRGRQLRVTVIILSCYE
jgi:hypothetical protein